MSRKSDSTLRDLFACVTVSEICERWHMSDSAVQYAIEHGKVDCRKSGGTWLVTTESLIRYWGKPEPPDLNTVELTLPRWRRIA